MFEESYRIIKEQKIKHDFDSETFGYHYKVQGSTKEYITRIYLKVSSWFQQCNCEVGVSNRPWGLCKHSIATIVHRFLEINNLKLKENVQIKVVDLDDKNTIRKLKKR
jgi:hypothetical protein